MHEWLHDCTLNQSRRDRPLRLRSRQTEPEPGRHVLLHGARTVARAWSPHPARPSETGGTTGKEPGMSETVIFVGVDVSKARLDVAVRPSGDTLTVLHDEAGIAGLVMRLHAWQPAAVVLEATGDLQLPLVSALIAAGLPVHVVNP